MIGLELTIRAYTDIIQAKDTPSSYRLHALDSRAQTYKIKAEFLDGKASLNEIFSFIDEQEKEIEEQQQQEESRNQARGLTNENSNPLKDDVSKHS